MTFGNFTGEEGVLGEVFEIPPTQRGTFDIGSGSQNDADPFLQAFFRQRLTNLEDQVAVPGGSQRGSGREAGGGHALVKSHMVRRADLLAQTVGSISHHDGRDSESLQRFQEPEILP